jgi:replicative superfamily II helicase
VNKLTEHNVCLFGFLILGMIDQLIHDVCSSRKGAEETAIYLLAQSSRGVSGSLRDNYVQDESQKRALHAAASQVFDKQLQQTLPGGIGIHHGNLQPQDRTIVENLFLNRHLMVCSLQ